MQSLLGTQGDQAHENRYTTQCMTSPYNLVVLFPATYLVLDVPSRPF